MLLCSIMSWNRALKAENYEISELGKDFVAAKFKNIHKAAEITFDIQEMLFSNTGSRSVPTPTSFLVIFSWIIDYLNDYFALQARAPNENERLLGLGR
jgi:hypothetical protein